MLFPFYNALLVIILLKQLHIGYVNCQSNFNTCRSIQSRERKEIVKEVEFVDYTLPLPVVPEKVWFNLWENSSIQTEVKWAKPENSRNFNSISYEIQMKEEDGDWQVLNEVRIPLYRVYFAEGKAIFNRMKICQKSSTIVVQLRIRPVGVVYTHGREEKKYGPFSENIVFSIEGSTVANE